MLEKFFKFLKGSPDERDFDGSYLDHLLERIRPRVDAKLQRCREHDPVLLVVTEILRSTDPGRWSDELACPLTDDQSRELTAPPPPDQPAAGADEGFEIVVSSAAHGANSPAEAGSADIENDGESSGDLASSDEQRPVEPDNDDRSTDAASDVNASSNSGQARTRESTEADELASELDEPQPVDEPQPASPDAGHMERLDSPALLRAGRIFLGFLIENDRLPIEMQLTMAETMLARDLLLGYFGGQDHRHADYAEDLLELVEQKFNEAAFSQARILLHLFQTDRSTQINNDRNIFYEDMIMRLGIQRRHPLDRSAIEDMAQPAQQDNAGERLLHLADCLDRGAQIRCHLFDRSPEAVADWRAFADQSRRDDAADVFARYIPPKRWRPLLSAHDGPIDCVRGHVSSATLKRYIVRHLETCYFVLRAVGDTGLESYLDCFFDWTEARFDVDSVQLMPLLYRRTMTETHLIDDIFEECFDRFYRDRAAELLDQFTDAQITAAANKSCATIASIDYDQVPGGHYDLGGLIFDQLLDMTYPRPAFGFKLHRLS